MCKTVVYLIIINCVSFFEEKIVETRTLLRPQIQAPTVMSHMYNSGDFAPPYQMKSPSMNLIPRHSMSAPMSGISTGMSSAQSKYHKNDKPSSLLVDTSGGKSTTNQKLSATTWAAANEDYNKPRRIWVKMSRGTPTTILAHNDDLIDDLKSQIIQKYPNSIGRFNDAANLTLKLEKLSSANNDNTLETPSGKRTGELVSLEPDQNVWQVLDTYFPQGMGMKDAIIIESSISDSSRKTTPVESNHRHSFSDQDGPITKTSNDRSQIKHPQPLQADPIRRTSTAQNISSQQQQQQHSQSLIQTLKNFPEPKSSYSSMPGAPYKDRSVSPSITAAKNSPIPRNQSHTNVVQSPVQKPNSQAILLLPKNFSINSNSNGTPSRAKTSHELGTSSKEDIQNAKVNTDLPEERSVNKDKQGDVGIVSSPSPAPQARTSKADILPSLTKTISSNKGSDKSNDPALEKVFPSISVLVVEDNAINQAILGAFLRKRKIHYQIAKNGQEAIDKWKKGGFHLVLMDIQLPVKSGIEATKEIRHLEKLNKIGVFDDTELSKLALNELQPDDKLDTNTFRSPVIIVALTASSNSSVDRKNALTAGCNDYLTKPVNLVWLQNKITEWGCMQALIDFEGWKGKKNWSAT